MANKAIGRSEINAWNRIVYEAAGTRLYYTFALSKERKDGKRWIYVGHYAIRGCYKEQEGERFYIKNIKGILWLYWENPDRTEQERWMLNDAAEKFFL